MNIDRVSPRQYSPAPQRRVHFDPVVQTKTFRNSDPINATRPTIHASRLESVLKTSPAKKALVEKKPEKPPPRPIYQTPETPAKAAGRAMFWCAMGSLALIPAFGPGALVITGICAFVSAIYFIQHNRIINQEKYHEDRTHFANANRSLSEQPRTGYAAGSIPPHHASQYRQSAHSHSHGYSHGPRYEASQLRAAQPSHYNTHTYTRPSAGRQTKRV